MNFLIVIYVNFSIILEKVKKVMYNIHICLYGKYNVKQNGV